MFRSAWTTVVLIALLLQTAAGLCAYGVAQKSRELSHVIVHVQTTHHHRHHDDGSLHLEQAGKESAHQHADEGMQQPALLPGAAAALPDLRPHSVGRADAAALTTVFLESPLRPPRRTA